MACFYVDVRNDKIDINGSKLICHHYIKLTMHRIHYISSLQNYHPNYNFDYNCDYGYFCDPSVDIDIRCEHSTHMYNPSRISMQLQPILEETMDIENDQSYTIKTHAIYHTTNLIMYGISAIAGFLFVVHFMDH